MTNVSTINKETGFYRPVHTCYLTSNDPMSVVFGHWFVDTYFTQLKPGELPDFDMMEYIIGVNQ